MVIVFGTRCGKARFPLAIGLKKTSVEPVSRGEGIKIGGTEHFLSFHYVKLEYPLLLCIGGRGTGFGGCFFGICLDMFLFLVAVEYETLDLVGVVVATTRRGC